MCQSQRRPLSTSTGSQPVFLCRPQPTHRVDPTSAHHLAEDAKVVQPQNLAQLKGALNDAQYFVYNVTHLLDLPPLPTRLATAPGRS